MSKRKTFIDEVIAIGEAAGAVYAGETPPQRR
jgi:hypothetical protein